ncbi:MAG: isoaspartyl peptidase/L-asparaginase [Pseudomonadota bacterium]
MSARRIFSAFVLLALSILASAPPVEALETSCARQETFALALHGGAVWGRVVYPKREAFLLKELRAGRARLRAGGSALDVVADAVAAMEDSGLFNAGRGSVANKAGEIEMDASIMSGRHLRAGSVASVRRVKNPVTAARLVMDNTPQVMMAGPAADERLIELGAEAVDQSYFRYSDKSFSGLRLPETLSPPEATPETPAALRPFVGIWAGVLSGRLPHVLVLKPSGEATVALGANESLGLAEPVTLKARTKRLNDFLIVETPRFRLSYRIAKDGGIEARITVTGGLRASGKLRRRPDLLNPGGTVGAVALDRCGNLAAATSTGGFGAKPPGRIGDSPIIGAGTYADNRSAAVSATGHGEYFIRHAVAHDITARMRHGGESLVQAGYQVIFKELRRAGGRGGIIAIDKDGKVVMLYNTDGMVRGSTTNRLSPTVATYQSD